MVADSKRIRSERHVEIAAVLERDTGMIIDRWARRAAEEQSSTARLHHETLLDQLPQFLRAMAESLAVSHAAENGAHKGAAVEHGGQRWETGWSLPEVVRDFQILRIVILDYLDEVLDRSLQCREVIAVGLVLDEAIAASVGSYVKSREAYIATFERERGEQLMQSEVTRHAQRADALREINRRKDEFLAVLGHELRNPIAPITNVLHALRLRGEDRTTREWANGVLERQVNHLTRLIDDLLDASRIGYGKIQLQRQRLDLNAVARAVVEDLRSTIEAAGLNITLATPPEPVLVEGDGTRLGQVIRNLLTNATKFTPVGGLVSVRVDRDVPTTPDPARAAVTVRDTGVGIEPAVLINLFEPFVQEDRSLSRNRGGLGLGLSLVKGFAELHGGGVIATSDGPGRGAEFVVWLPLLVDPALPTPTNPTAPAAAGSPTGRLRVLLVEDNRDAAESLRILLELSGHQARVAHTGTAGVAEAQRFLPDVVLCDLGLPGQDGFAVAAQLRADARTARCRLVALTGYGTDDDLQKCQAAGFEIHLIKPIDPEQLEQLLQQFLTPAQPPG